MNTRTGWLVFGLAMGLSAGCNKDRAVDDDTPIEVRLHECPDDPLVECQIDGDVAVETHMSEMGTPERRITYTYRDLPDGNRSVLKEFDTGANGTTDARLTTTYDDGGNPLEALWEPNLDTGRGERRHTFLPPGTPCMADWMCEDGFDLCVCNEHDHLIGRQQGEWDPPDQTRTRTDRIHRIYDADGNCLVREVDDHSDGRIDERVSWTYDESGNMLSQVGADIDGDGTVDAKRGTYDESGNLLSVEFDYNADGTIDVRRSLTYDESGNMLSEEWHTDGDGTVHTRSIYTYDESGNRLSEERSDGDGTVDERTTWTYDESGNMLSFEEDTDGDGTVDRRGTYTYDESGNMLTSEVDGDGDGTVDSGATFTYDADGNRLSRVFIDGNGIVQVRSRYTYDADDHLLVETLESNARNLRCTYTPPCPPEVFRDPEQPCPEPTCVDL